MGLSLINKKRCQLGLIPKDEIMDQNSFVSTCSKHLFGLITETRQLASIVHAVSLWWCIFLHYESIETREQVNYSIVSLYLSLLWQMSKVKNNNSVSNNRNLISNYFLCNWVCPVFHWIESLTNDKERDLLAISLFVSSWSQRSCVCVCVSQQCMLTVAVLTVSMQRNFSGLRF